MAPRYQKRNLRQQWTQENLERALELVARGQSQRQACLRTNVPRRTLQRYQLMTTSSAEARPAVDVPNLGRKATLTPKQEQDLKQRIKRLAEVGCPLTPL